MSGSISEFKSRLKGGGSRANLFEVEVSFPPFAGGAQEVDSGLYLAKSTNLPSSNLGVIEVPYQGRMLPVAGDRTFEEWTVTFWNDTEFSLRDAFERWSNGINGHSSNTGLVDPEDYMRDISVFQLNKAKERTKEYSLEGCWPSVVGEIEVSHDSTDTIEEFAVTFRYVQWTSNTTS